MIITVLTDSISSLQTVPILWELFKWEGKYTKKKNRIKHLAVHHWITYKVAFRGCVSLLPLLLGSTELPVPREVLGREVLEARWLEEDWARLSNLDLIEQNMELLNIFEQRSGVKKGSFK